MTVIIVINTVELEILYSLLAIKKRMAPQITVTINTISLHGI